MYNLVDMPCFVATSCLHEQAREIILDHTLLCDVVSGAPPVASTSEILCYASAARCQLCGIPGGTKDTSMSGQQ